jgi:hypothetical protein
MLLEDDDVVKRFSLSIIPMLLLCMQMLTPLAVGKTNAPSKPTDDHPVAIILSADELSESRSSFYNNSSVTSHSILTLVDKNILDLQESSVGSTYLFTALEQEDAIKLEWLTDGRNPPYMYFIEKLCASDSEGEIVATVLGNMGQTVQLNNDRYYAFNARDYSAASSQHVTYRLGAIYPTGQKRYYQTATCVLSRSTLPTSFELTSFRANPTDFATTLAYNIPWLPWNSQVNISILDDQGFVVKTLVEGTHNAGKYFTKWDGTNDQNKLVESGIYFARMTIDGTVRGAKVLLVVRM